MTGEERLGPEDARYLVCTVEAMPLHREAAFLAVDEIQLCADLERGHVFTDRLLNARGSEETMFLGSDTIRPLLKRLVPEAEVITRPRFSILGYGGDVKLTRLPRRSAVVAFTAADVYALAEVVRRQKGGAAVVMGALSPRTRNAQVAMYQAGEVDHLVATDAIGMGLNMDLTHVAFANLRKFDGRENRRLTTPEIAQIAGRAGRHMSDGTFGTTGTCGELDPKEVEAVENHTFPPLKALRWRNARLDFASVAALQASLDEAPPLPCLVKVRDALDDRSLAFLSRRDEVKARADRPDRVRLLWQVCQIPDFRKTLTDAHLHLLATVYRHLTSGRGVLPNEWVGGMISRLEQFDGDLDAIVARIAHVRTWTYMSHRAEWLADPAHWQARAREVEDRLSDALHERLTQRFVDRRTSALLRSLREHGELAARVERDGEIVVDDQLVGRLLGLGFVPEGGEADGDLRLLTSAARRAAGPSLRARALELAGEPDAAFALGAATEEIVWRGAVVARLRPGPGMTTPRVEMVADPTLDSRAAGLARRRLEAWLAGWVGERLAPLTALEEASGREGLGAPGRGIVFRLHERLGLLERAQVEDLLPGLAEADRATLTRLGIRFGWHHLFLPALLRPAAVEARVRLWRLAHAGTPPLAIPPAGRTVLRGPTVLPPEAAAVAGFALFGDFALRVDVLERLAARVRALSRVASPFALPPELGAEAGLNRAELLLLVEALGFRPVPSAEGNAPTLFARPERRPYQRPDVAERKRRAMAGPATNSPFSVLARLKAAT
jgi:ATP-dependent RNA helicase SUPV3L1/SUV3